MTCQAQQYLTRPPEQLVVRGYRHWLSGYATGSVGHWNAAWSLYAEHLGSRNGRLAISGLSNFIGTLGRCSTCPLRFFPSETDCVCRDECLVLGLIAGIQCSDDEAQQCALAGLACPLRREEVMAEAGEFALILKSFGQTLLPIPAHAIADIIVKSSVLPPETPEANDNPTYH